jgi:hypothetical protein
VSVSAIHVFAARTPDLRILFSVCQVFSETLRGRAGKWKDRPALPRVSAPSRAERVRKTGLALQTAQTSGLEGHGEGIDRKRCSGALAGECVYVEEER